MHYIQKNVISLISAMRRGAAVSASVDQNFKIKSHERVQAQWDNSCMLLLTELDTAVEPVTLFVNKSASDSPVLTLAEMTLPFSRALFLLYKQIRAGLVNSGHTFDTPNNGGMLRIQVDGYVCIEYRNSFSQETADVIWCHNALSQ